MTHQPSRKEGDRGYLTQCDCTAWSGCDKTIRLKKPGRWRCDRCTDKRGPLLKEEITQ